MTGEQRILRGKVTFRSLAERVKGDVNREAAKIRDPEGDVQPRLYMYNPSEQKLAAIDVPWHWFRSRGSKDFLVENLVSTAVRAGGVTLVAFQHTGYGSTVSVDDLSEEELAGIERYEHPASIPMPSQDPERIEMVMVHVLDAEVRETWTRQILRAPERRPRFGHWQKEKEMAWGKVIDPIAAALR